MDCDFIDHTMHGWQKHSDSHTFSKKCHCKNRFRHTAYALGKTWKMLM